MNEKTETHEPLAAILAEMRDGIHTGRADIIDAVNERLRSYADRIEAAAERERAEAKNYFAKLHDGPSMICTAKNCAVRNIGLSLAAPARNCDRFQTAEEAVVAFADHLRAWENAHGVCSEYPDHPVKVPAGAFAWLFAPAEGGDHA